MRAVTQEHPSGCAVACVASVLGLPYRSSLRLFRNPGNAAYRGFYCREIVAALKRKNALYQYNHISEKKRHLLRIPGCIAYVRRSDRYPLGHILARSRNGLWMDPWINYPAMPPRGGFRKRLPGKACYVVYPVLSASTR